MFRVADALLGRPTQVQRAQMKRRKNGKMKVYRSLGMYNGETPFKDSNTLIKASDEAVNYYHYRKDQRLIGSKGRLVQLNPEQGQQKQQFSIRYLIHLYLL